MRTLRSPRTLRTLAALVVGGSALSLSLAGPASADTQQCEVGQTRYVKQLSYNLQALSIPQSFTIATGSGVTVAVVDSGVNTDNAHLQGGVVKGGKSFVPGPPTEDFTGHGTAVAGIIAAQLLNGKSAMWGAAPGSTIMPVRVYQNESSQPGEATRPYPPDGTLVARGIRWAADHGADVINVSISAPAQDASVPALNRAVRHAYRRGALVVASSGDVAGGQSSVETRRFPAASEHALAVAAANSSGQVDDYSVHGPWVGVSAPGSNVLFTFNGNGDCQTPSEPATSWAAPFVAALAAQVKEKYPDESVDQLVYRIEASAKRPVADQRNDDEGWGLIQPYDALTLTLDPSRPGPPFPGSSQGAQRAGEQAGDVIPPTVVQPDRLADSRSHALWWTILGGGLVALALVVRPVMLRVASRPRATGGRRRRTRE